MEAILALEDGRVFRGRAFGALGERTGEVVFNTSMTGYQEILSDPSYRGQIVTMTCPEIGNVGTNVLDDESNVPQVEGFVVRELSEQASNWRATQSLHEHLRQQKIPGIAEVDTRAITRHLRTRGAMRGIVSTSERDVDTLVRKARESPRLGEIDLVGLVTCPAPYAWSAPRDERWAAPFGMGDTSNRLRCVAYDFGAKRNIFRLLHESGFDVTVVPATTSAADALALAPDAVFLSNGPGDPAAATTAIEAVRGLVGKVPMFGICLGHQIAALAVGATTFKLKFGHRGANHPVKDLRTGKVAVTSQNHGYAVAPETLPKSIEVTHLNLNDGTCEGFLDRDARLLAVQYHPESSPGPHDSLSLFREFRAMAATEEVR
ncbi:MAG TPA: glutamine-hydrolyzing carbamoyl-phosphate synthase small subunit [Candidatus Polarisedimenticolaceae bacterium]